ELGHQVALIRQVANKVFTGMGKTIGYKIGTMIEIPRVALVADEPLAHRELAPNLALGAVIQDYTVMRRWQCRFCDSHDDVAPALQIFPSPVGCERACVITRIKTLFHAYPDLILSIRAFLPKRHAIRPQDLRKDKEPVDYPRAISLVNRIKAGPPSSSATATRWRELQGNNSWNGLLDPLDMDLRRSIISYGELVQATYDGFNRERRSPHAGACLYGRADLLPGVGVAAAGRYAVTRFVYATSALPVPGSDFPLLPLPETREAWTRESNWIGYVAVATDEGAAELGRRDVVVAWRGTVKDLEWANDFTFTPVSAAPVLGSAAAANPLAVVHQGFLSVYTSSNADS
ncbi:hypothetical protein ACJX0J_027450, partial [Zea mays]